jgi:hypothetical protein
MSAKDPFIEPNVTYVIDEQKRNTSVDKDSKRDKKGIEKAKPNSSNPSK